MSGQTWLTLVGNLTADPDLRFTAGGDAVANFTVASTPRAFDKDTRDWKDGETLFMRCTAWRGMAENVAESLYRGARVVVYGRLVSRSFEDKEGQRRTVTELQVEEVGPALRYATAKVTRTPERNAAGSGSGWAPSSSAGSDSRPAVSDSRAPVNEDPWGGALDEPAF